MRGGGDGKVRRRRIERRMGKGRRNAPLKEYVYTCT